jgi:acetoacetate decarboxylase
MGRFPNDERRKPMGFVKTREEIQRIQEALCEPRFFSAQMISVQYRTRPEIVRRVLPPGLEPTDTPLVTAMVGRWGRSNCVHAFAGGALYVQARHGQYVGDYCLAMPMSTDAAIIFGRELFGEPKKQAMTTFERKGNRLRGKCVRYGKPILSIDATMDTRENVTEGGFVNFHYKFLPSADGRGLQWDPALVMATFQTKVTLSEKGRAKLTLGNTVHDPLGEIEIVEIVSASYVEGDITSRCQTLASIKAEDFLPYAYGKVDDWSALNNLNDRPWKKLRVA